MLLTERFKLTASVLFLLSMSTTSGFAANTYPVVKKNVFALTQEYGLNEASQQYIMHYTSRSGVDGHTQRTDTAAIFIPKGKAPEEGWPVVVWAHGTVGVAERCAPSLNERTVRDKQYLNTWLSLGYAIVAPDYAGLGSEGLHHYLNARAEAWSILDGVRAALHRFPLKNDLIFVGQSQGAHAAFSSVGFQPEYAPELNIRATILTGTPYFSANIAVSDIFSAVENNNQIAGDPKIPYIFYIFLAAADTNPSLNASDFFQDRALSFLEQAKTLCITPLTEKTLKAGLNAGNTLKPAIESLLNSGVKTMLYPTMKIKHPVFIGIGSADINVPTAMQKRFADAVEAAGTKTEVHIYDGLDHSGTVNPSLRDSVPFIIHSTEAGRP